MKAFIICLVLRILNIFVADYKSVMIVQINVDSFIIEMDKSSFINNYSIMVQKSCMCTSDFMVITAII